jgi:hypothetical protein
LSHSHHANSAPNICFACTGKAKGIGRIENVNQCHESLDCRLTENLRLAAWKRWWHGFVD